MYVITFPELPALPLSAGDAVGSGEAVGVGCTVGVGSAVGVEVGVGEGVGDGVGVAVGVGVGEAVGSAVTFWLAPDDVSTIASALNGTAAYTSASIKNININFFIYFMPFE